MLEIHEQILRLRKEKGYSQEELAEKVGVSRQAISKWERADAMPDIQNLMNLADVLKVTTDELLGRDFNSQITCTSQAPSKECDEVENLFIEKRKRVLEFTSVVAIISYLLLGYFFGLWAYWLVIYLLIPLAYTAFNVFNKRSAQVKKNNGG